MAADKIRARLAAPGRALLDGERAVLVFLAIVIALASFVAEAAEADLPLAAVFVADACRWCAGAGMVAEAHAAFAAGAVVVGMASLHTHALADKAFAAIGRLFALTRDAFPLGIAIFVRTTISIVDAASPAELIDAALAFAVAVCMRTAASRTSRGSVRFGRPSDADFVVVAVGVAFADHGAAG